MKLVFVFLYILIILASFQKEGTASVVCNALLRSSESGYLPTYSGFPLTCFRCMRPLIPEMERPVQSWYLSSTLMLRTHGSRYVIDKPMVSREWRAVREAGCEPTAPGR